MKKRSRKEDEGEEEGEIPSDEEGGDTATADGKRKHKHKHKHQHRRHKDKRRKGDEADGDYEDEGGSDGDGGDDDDDDVSEASPRKQPQSQSQSQPEKTTAVMEDEEDDKYDEEFMGDEKDRAYLLGLTEIERERVISERYERRKKREEAMGIRSRPSASASASASARERNLRERGRPSVGGRAAAASAALSDIKKRRGGGKHSDDESADLQVMTPSPSASEDEGEGADAGARAKSSEASSEALRKVDFADVKRIQMTRAAMAKWLNEPFFEETVTGFFVRVGIGKYEGKPVYRMARIDGTRDATRQYKCDNKTTNTVLLLHLPGSKSLREMRVEYISNTPIEEPEFTKYRRDAESRKEPMLLYDIATMTQRVAAAAAHVHTDAEVREMVRQREQLRSTPVSVPAELVGVRTKIHVLLDRGVAEDAPEMVALNEELARLQLLQERVEEQLAAAARAGKKSVVSIAVINERARRENFEAQSAYVATRSDGPAQADVFQRIKTAPTMFLTAKAKSAAEKPKDAATAAKSTTEEVVKVAPAKPMDTDAKLRQAHNFTVTLDDSAAPLQVQTVPATAPTVVSAVMSAISAAEPSSAPVQQIGNRLSFSDYLKQRQSAPTGAQ